MPKYSSFKKYQTMTENFRQFLDEDSGEEEGRHYRDDEEEDEKHLKDLEKDVRYDKDRVHEDSGAEESEHDWKNARADREDADELDDEGDKRGADKLRSDADYEEDHIDENEENLDEITIVRGLYRTSEPEMEDMLRDMYNELHDQGKRDSAGVMNAVDAMEQNVDDRKYSSAAHSSAQAQKYQGAQQYMTGRLAFRAMMRDFGELILTGIEVEEAVKSIMGDAKRGKYSLKNPGMRENKNQKRKGKKTTLLEIKRRRKQRARRKQNK